MSSVVQCEQPSKGTHISLHTPQGSKEPSTCLNFMTNSVLIVRFQGCTNVHVTSNFCLHAILLGYPLVSTHVCMLPSLSSTLCLHATLCHLSCVFMLPFSWSVFACYPPLLGYCWDPSWCLLGLCNSRDVLLNWLSYRNCAFPQKKLNLPYLAYPRSVDFTLP